MFEIHEDFIFSVAFSSNDKLIASGSGDFTLKLLNIETKKIIFVGKHFDKVLSV